MNKFMALAMAAFVATASTASATTTITYTGTVFDRQGSGNQDQYFGSVLAGTSTYSLVYTINPGGTLANPNAYATKLGGPGVITAALTINGVSRSVGGTYESFVTATNGKPNSSGFPTDEVNQRSQDFMDGAIYRDVYVNTFISSYLSNFLADADVTSPFVYHPVSADGVFNNFHINDMDWQTRVGSSIYLSLGVDSVTVAAAPPLIGSAVPEPNTWAMMICGFGLVGASMRRRTARVRFA